MNDVINHPPHYRGTNGVETIAVVEGFGLGFNLGNTIKYITRADRKGDAIEDLMKARFYLNREIENRQRQAAVDDQVAASRCKAAAEHEAWVESEAAKAERRQARRASALKGQATRKRRGRK